MTKGKAGKSGAKKGRDGESAARVTRLGTLTAVGERKLAAILRRAQAQPALAKRVPDLAARPSTSRRRHHVWQVGFKLVGSAMMTRLNGQYRGKAYPTDVLSFSSPEVFASLGHLGELVICLPTLRRQARELDAPDADELEILLVHGVLHLLGFDHELGAREARAMAKWERVLLPKRLHGLISRAVAENV
jgi:rRNA maturation RNase YbeY